MREKIKDGLVLFLIAVIVVTGYFGYHAYFVYGDRKVIQRKMISMNTELVKVQVEPTGVNTPFYLRMNDGDRIYKVTYNDNDEEKIGYAKMNTFEFWYIDGVYEITKEYSDEHIDN